MAALLIAAGHALLAAVNMFALVGWTLVLGFAASAAVQALVPRARITAALGRTGWREVALATAAGAASSSCSYAAAAVTRTLFAKGAALPVALAFLFASTNLVVELGLALLLLMGWVFTLAEWVGGIVLIVVLAVLVRATAPAGLVEDARARAQAGGGGHRHGAGAGGRLAAIAANFASDWRMLWRDLLLGFLIAGALDAFVPHGVWQALFVGGAHPVLRVPLNALLGPIVAMLSFVCSVGNVPLAAVLWGSGVSFGGVVAFLFADLLVLPLLDAYRRQYGWRMAAYLAAVFYAAIVVTAVVVDAGFSAAGLVPAHAARAVPVAGSVLGLNITTLLDLVALAIAIFLFRIAARAPAKHCH